MFRVDGDVVTTDIHEIDAGETATMTAEYAATSDDVGTAHVTIESDDDVASLDLPVESASSEDGGGSDDTDSDVGGGSETDGGSDDEGGAADDGAQVTIRRATEMPPRVTATRVPPPRETRDPRTRPRPRTPSNWAIACPGSGS